MFWVSGFRARAEGRGGIFSVGYFQNLAYSRRCILRMFNPSFYIAILIIFDIDACHIPNGSRFELVMEYFPPNIYLMHIRLCVISLFRIIGFGIATSFDV